MALSKLKGVARAASIVAMRTLLILRSRTLVPDQAALLVVAPHPDDEVLGCGGLIVRWVRQGLPVRVIFLTDGEASHRGHPRIAATELAARRRSEALAALATLGLPDPLRHVVFCSAPDGELDRLSPTTRQQLLESLMRELKSSPGALTCAPYRQGGSTEHTAACELTTEAIARVGGGVLLEYPIWAWWNPVRLLPPLRWPAENLRLPLADLRPLKLRALACHASQVEALPPWSAPVLPPIIAQACSGSHEFFFRRDVRPAPSDTGSSR